MDLNPDHGNRLSPAVKEKAEAARKDYTPFVAGEVMPFVCDQFGRLWGAREAARILSATRIKRWVDILETFGTPFLIDTGKPLHNIGEIQAWAMTYALDPANKAQLAAEAMEEIAKRATNPTNLADVCEWDETGKITKVIASKDLQPHHLQAIKKIGQGANGRIIVELHDFDTDRFMLARMAGLLAAPKEADNAPDQREDLRKVLEETSKGLSGMVARYNAQPRAPDPPERDQAGPIIDVPPG